jgi:hypothetical protein
MIQDRQKTLDRILKILALAEGTSFAGEAANARRMAEELIAKYNVSLPEDGKTPRDEICFETYVPWGKKWLWERIIGIAVSRLCGCEFYSTGRPDQGGEFENFKFVGLKPNVEACLYVLSEVHRQRQRAWVQYKADGGADNFGQFCFSFARGLENKIRHLVGSTQIQETKQAKLWFEARYQVNEGYDIKGRGSSEAGLAAGSGASLHRGTVSRPPPPPRIGR